MNREGHARLAAGCRDSKCLAIAAARPDDELSVALIATLTPDLRKALAVVGPIAAKWTREESRASSSAGITPDKLWNADGLAKTIESTSP
jgi:hypothetical protein